MRSGLLLFALAIAGCDLLPRDTAGTSERIAAGHVVRVGTVTPIGAEGDRFLDAVARDASARIDRRSDSLEPLLVALERGEVDLVVARFARDSDWRRRVALTPPLDGSKDGDRPLAVHAAARNGENRWVMRLERLARANAR